LKNKDERHTQLWKACMSTSTYSAPTAHTWFTGYLPSRMPVNVAFISSVTTPGTCCRATDTAHTGHPSNADRLRKLPFGEACQNIEHVRQACLSDDRLLVLQPFACAIRGHAGIGLARLLAPAPRMTANVNNPMKKTVFTRTAAGTDFSLSTIMPASHECEPSGAAILQPPQGPPQSASSHHTACVDMPASMTRTPHPRRRLLHAPGTRLSTAYMLRHESRSGVPVMREWAVPNSSTAGAVDASTRITLAATCKLATCHVGQVCMQAAQPTLEASCCVLPNPLAYTL
jgi:hypothetical protein